MKIYTAILLTILAALWLSGCATALGMPQGAKPDESIEQTVPTIALSVNKRNEATVKVGTPLLIEAVIGPADGRDGDEPIKLQGSSGGWGNMLALEIKDSQGKPIAGATAKPAFQTEASIDLSQETMGQMIWTVEFGPGRELPAGEYSVVASLDTTKSPGWKGKAASPAAKVKVLAASATLPEDDGRISTLAEIQVDSIQNRPQEAMAVADRYLSVHGGDLLILEAKGDLFAKDGKFKEALSTYDYVLSHNSPQTDEALREPPVNLIRKYQMASKELKKN